MVDFATTLSNAEAVIRLYDAAFGRQPDNAGLQFWTDQLGKGVTLATVAEGFAASSEFATRFGSTSDQTAFISELYHTVLSRTPTTDEVNYWKNAHVSNGTLLADFAASSEFITDTAFGVSKVLQIYSEGGTLDPTLPLSVADTVTPPVIIHDPGPTVFVNNPVPTAESHIVIHTGDATISPLYQVGGAAPVGGAGTPVDHWDQVTDQTSGFTIYTETQHRQLATFFTPTVTGTDANGVVHETVNVAGGTQNNSAGTHSDRAETSVGFVITGAADALTNPNYKAVMHTTGPGGFTLDATLSVDATGHQAWNVTASSNSALVGANIIPDDPTSTTIAGNTSNLAFAPFGGVADAHGDYSLEIDIVKVTGLNAGSTVAGVHLDIHAS